MRRDIFTIRGFSGRNCLNLSDTNIPKIKSCRYLCGWIKLHTMMKTEYEKCLAGEPFIGSRDPKIVETILRTRRLLAQFNATDYADTERKQALLREMFGSMGKGVHVDIDFHHELHVRG